MRRPIGRRRVANTASLWELLNLGSPEETRWMRGGLCAQTDPEAFFPEKGESTRAAKAVCVGCQVRAECLEWALDNREPHGVWGGLSLTQREVLLRRRAAAAEDLVLPHLVRVAADGRAV